jgi:dihydroneopterin aldolase
VSGAPPAPSAVRLTGAKVFVRELHIEAEIGVYDHEHGRRQPLVLEVELDLAAEGFEHIADTVNYETIVHMARAVAEGGHLKLVETFAERLALACLGDPRVLAARVRVEKPQALKPAMAGVEIRLERR